jgi:IG-like fold at C-terminal of FixG, putative oxidoreductase
LSLQGMTKAEMKIPTVSADYSDRVFAIQVEPDKATTLKVFVTLPKEALGAARQGFRFIAEDPASHERDVYQASFNYPGAN